MKKLFVLGLVFSVIGMFCAQNITMADESSTYVIKQAIEKYKNKNYLGCISDLRMETTKDPTSTISWYYLGNAYMNIAMKQQAHEAFDMVVQLNTVPKLTSYAIQAKLCMENTTKCDYQDFNNEQIVQLKANPVAFLDSYFESLSDKNKNKNDLEIEKLISGAYSGRIHPEASKVILQERTKMEQNKINSKAALPSDYSAMAMILEADPLDALKTSMQNYKNGQN